MRIRRPVAAAAPLADAEALQDRLDDLIQREAALDVQLRRVADLGVDDAVRGQVLARTRLRPGRARPSSA